MPYSWHTLSEEELDRNHWWTHVRRSFRRPDGTEGVYEFARKNDAVNILAQDADGRFVHVREYKYLLDGTTIGQPAGGLESGESPLDAAIRELREETGYEAGSWKLVGRCAGMPFLTNERISVFYATDLTRVGDHDDEVLEVVRLTPGEIDAAIRDGKMWDSHTIAAWQMVRLHLGL